jgi:integrase
MIDEKVACGETGVSCYFRALDRFFIENRIRKPILSQKIVELWCKRRESESLRTLGHRISAIRLLAKFLIRQGKVAYYFPKYSAPKIFNTYIPYIYSQKEIATLFAAADELKRSGNSWHLSYFPVAIRLLYSTGLRRGEADGLQWRNVDLKNEVLIIRQGKFRKDRFVPFSKQMTKILRKYAQSCDCRPDAFVFPSPKGTRCHRGTFTWSFRKVLNQAKIQHGGKGKGPRLHDLRHTFAVHNLEKWLTSGENVQEKLPILADYLGHKSLYGTQKYLRLTPSVFPEIALRMENSVGKLIRNPHNETD